MELIISQDKNNTSDICGHIENFLSDLEISNLYSHQTKKFIPATTRYRGLDKSIRDCLRIGGATVPQWLKEKLWRAICLYNERSYNFDLYPIDSKYHEFNIVRYSQKGNFFTTHRDCRPTLNHIYTRRPMRKISISVQLSSNYTGGDLEIAESFRQKDILGGEQTPPSDFRHKFKTIKKKGSLTIFTGFHMHESKPLESGLRDVLVCFINGESKVW